MNLLIFYILIITFIYFCLIIFYRIKWSTYKLSEYAISGIAEKISVLIPVYNENENLLRLLTALREQSLNKNDFEILIVDDHSDNFPENLLEKAGLTDLNIRIIKNTYPKGKKYALKIGVENAVNNCILSTDADCIPHIKWLETIQNAFNSYNPKLISAPVVMTHNNSVFQKFQSFEFSSLVCTGAASISAGSPIMCNGANLAFDKQLFLDAFPSLKPEVKTGDDIFLLEYTKKHFPKQIIFLKEQTAIVYTRAEKGLLDFFKQRIRWTSKSLFYVDPVLILVSGIVFLLNINIVLTAAMSIMNINFIYLVLIQYGLKSIADLILLRNFVIFIQQKELMNIFPFAQLIYPFYIFLVSITGILKSGFLKYDRAFRK